MARVGIPQIVAKMTEMNDRIKKCEESQTSNGFVTTDDVNHIIGLKLQSQFETIFRLNLNIHSIEKDVT